MAISTIGTFLMYKAPSASSYSKLVDIKNQPALGSSPEQIETTTLSDSVRTFIPGLEGNDAKEYTCNYDKTVYATLKALEGQELDLAVWFGGDKAANGIITPTGADGQFPYKGFVNVFVNESDLNAVHEMTVTTTASTGPGFVVPNE